MFYKSQYIIYCVFLFSFGLAFAAHYLIWQYATPMDSILWSERIGNLVEDLSSRGDFVVFEGDFLSPTHQWESRYAGHPGGSITATGALFKAITGEPLNICLRLAISFLVAFAAGGIAVTTKLLAPGTYWWVAATVITAVHALYYYATPTNIVVSPLIVLILLLTWMLWERKASPPKMLIYFFGVILGLSFATRIDISLFISAACLVFLQVFLGWRNIFKIILTAGAVFMGLNPVIWFSGKDLLTVIMLSPPKILINSIGEQVTLSTFLLFSPLTLISWIAAVLFLMFPRSLRNPIPAKIFLLSVLVTFTAVLVFQLAGFQTLRYYLPLILFWDIILAYWLLAAGASFKWQSKNPEGVISGKINALAPILILIVIIGSHLFLAFYNYLIPGGQGVV